jgi:lysophospholipase L1-like esterase
VRHLATLAQAHRKQNVPLFDIRKRPGWTSYTLANSLGFMSDQRHPSALGYADIAAFYAESIQTLLALA